METKARETYRMPWFADRLVRGYEDPTEPNLHPEHYTRYIEFSAYEKLEAENKKLREALKLSDNKILMLDSTNDFNEIHQWRSDVEKIMGDDYFSSNRRGGQMRLASHEIKKIELSAKCTDELICKLASGKAEWSMSIPPQEYDTDMQLIREVREHIPNLIKHISVVEDENKKLRELLKVAGPNTLLVDEENYWSDFFKLFPDDEEKELGEVGE